MSEFINKIEVITSSPLIERKVKEYVRHSLFALDFFHKNDYEHALGDFRKSAEALMKIRLYAHFGDSDGEKIIMGEKKTDLSPVTPPRRPEYQDYLDIMRQYSLLGSRHFSRLVDIQKKTNPAAHNPNVPEDYFSGAELCKSQWYELTKFLYGELGKDLPENLSQAYRGKTAHAQVLAYQDSEWEDLANFVNGFSKHSRYLLVLPPDLEGLSPEQLKVLARVNWSFVMDFNPDSKSKGAFRVFSELPGMNLLPITIEQKGQRNIVGSGSYGAINWLFANGLRTISNTVTQGVKDWRAKKYHTFIKDLFRDFFSKETHRYVVLYLWDEFDFVDEITRSISDIETLQSDLISHVYLSKDEDRLARIESLDKYGIQYLPIRMSAAALINGLLTITDSVSPQSESILVPGRTKEEEQTIIDLSSIYHKLLDDHVSAVHINIADRLLGTIDGGTPAFFQGEQITWKELATDIDTKRNKYEELTNKLRTLLQTTKRSFKFELYHKPGAGGSTLAARAAFDLRAQFPTVVINKFDSTKTYKAISLFIDKVNRPVLAVVEAAHVGLTDIEDLIRACNGNKLSVCFLYVRRSLNLGKAGEYSVYLNDSMTDINERDKFLAKAGLYAKDTATLKQLSTRPPSETDVIDFSMAIDQSLYSKNRIIGYVREYIAKMPENHIEFTVYASLIYYYSQKTVSSLIFRSLFKKSLEEELRLLPADAQFIRKILIQGFEQSTQSYSEYWRPRFSKFAESVLNLILGGQHLDNWKDQIDLHAVKLIQAIRKDSEYLVDETRAILKSVFLERNNEDLLGTEEEWSGSVSNDRFSFLLRDIANPAKQKSVLHALVEAYPTESHFLGHLARFLYEMAEEKGDFQEAESYIARAFETEEGAADYNLQHLAGMCKRRQIEYLKRRYDQNEHDEISMKVLEELAESANSFFSESRRINPFNIHAYVAQIQTLILTIDFGRELSGTERKEIFIMKEEFQWYLRQYQTVVRLIDEATVLITHQESLGKTTKLERAKYYISSGEGHSLELVGDHAMSREMFRKMVDTVSREFRPYVRILYIKSILLWKVRGIKKKIDRAWQLLGDEDIAVIDAALTANILQDQSNLVNFRLWFKLVRFSQKSTSIQEILARMKIWFNNSEGSRVLQLEASYYLYVLYAAQTIDAGDSFSTVSLQEAKTYLKKCIELSQSGKFVFEYLGQGSGLGRLINHRDYEKDDYSSLKRVTGTIANIYTRQRGRVVLHSGLDAFFVPHAGNFNQGLDETVDVSFFLGFRHEGLYAFDVRRVADEVKSSSPSSITTQQPQIEAELEFIEPIEEIIELVEPEKEQEVVEKPVLKGLTVVGKVDLDKLSSPQRKRRRF